jgi:hypothetical protein
LRLLFVGGAEAFPIDSTLRPFTVDLAHGNILSHTRINKLAESTMNAAAIRSLDCNKCESNRIRYADNGFTWIDRNNQVFLRPKNGAGLRTDIVFVSKDKRRGRRVINCARERLLSL